MYRADIITERLADARTLAQLLEQQALDTSAWRHIGQTIASFHTAGVHHADMNANNIMLVGDAVYVLDFDRGRIRERGPWERDVIARLKRSLVKLQARNPSMHFSERDWKALISGLG
jgi:3-deoxy-D-manno-octulosonic acid kinase